VTYHILGNGHSREGPSYFRWEGDTHDPENMINALSEIQAEKQAEFGLS
jgi:hypothetical protein